MKDRLFEQLRKIPGFELLGMDQQGEVYVNSKKFCEKCGQAWGVHNDDGSCVKDNDLCPQCGGEIHFGPLEICDGEFAYHSAECTRCDFIGRQWQQIIFNGWQQLIGMEFVDLDKGVQ